MKLDMSQAWNDAVTLLSGNRDVIAVVAGVFFFLPSALATLFLPQATELEALAGAGQTADPQQMLDAFIAFYSQVWWVIVLIGLMQAIGVLSLLALLTDSKRPTVGEALAFGVKALIPSVAAQLLASLLIIAVVGLLVLVGLQVHPVVAVLLGLAGCVLAIYGWVKFSLVSPVIAMEKQFNPIAALQRSWRITKGNSLLLFAFYLLLGVAMLVVSLIVNMILAAFTLLGEQVGLFASAIGGSLVSMAMAVLFMAVLAAVYRQLTGASSGSFQGTFG